MALGRILARAAAVTLLGCSGCGVFGPPGGDAQYPAVRVPIRSPAARSSASTPPTSVAAPESAPTRSATENAASGTAGADEPSPDSRVRLQRPAASGTAPEHTAPPQGYLPDPPPLSERARWLYDVQYDRGVIRTGAPELECLLRPTATPRHIGRFAFELWLGSELIERVRFDFPLLGAEVPRQGQRRPLHEEPSFAPGARVSARLQVPASTRATRAQILDRATGQVTAVAWPPRSEPAADLCSKAASAPTSTGH